MRDTYKYAVVSKKDGRQSVYKFRKETSAHEALMELCDKSLSEIENAVIGLFDIEKGDELVAKFENMRGEIGK